MRRCGMLPRRRRNLRAANEHVGACPKVLAVVCDMTYVVCGLVASGKMFIALPLLVLRSESLCSPFCRAFPLLEIGRTVGYCIGIPLRLDLYYACMYMAVWAGSVEHFILSLDSQVVLT